MVYSRLRGVSHLHEQTNWNRSASADDRLALLRFASRNAPAFGQPSATHSCSHFRRKTILHACVHIFGATHRLTPAVRGGNKTSQKHQSHHTHENQEKNQVSSATK